MCPANPKREQIGETLNGETGCVSRETHVRCDAMRRSSTAAAVLRVVVLRWMDPPAASDLACRLFSPRCRVKRFQAQALHAAALAEDPSVFDYDGHFDSFQDARKQKLAAADAERTERKSRYINSLIAKKEERDREENIIYERRLLKERQKEDHLYGDKEKFVTAAYRAKLEEDAKWAKEEKLREAREAADDVTKKGSDFMSGFYHNLMNRNENMGAEAVGQKGRREAPEPSAEKEAAAIAKMKAEEEGRRRRALVEDERLRREKEEKEKRAAERRMEAEREGRGGGEREASRGGLEIRQPVVTPMDDAARRGRSEALPAPVDPNARRNKEDAISAAKQRYLERKRKAVGP